MPKKQYYHSLVILCVSFFVGILGAVIGTFVVSAHGGDTSKIHACIKTTLLNGPNIRIVDANTNCNNNETALDWNIQGVPGPSGPPGPTGVPGGSSSVTCSVCRGKDIIARTQTTTLSGINLDFAILNNAQIFGEDFSSSSFVHAILALVNAGSNNISGAANFANTNLTDTNLFGANMHGVNFSGANLTRAYLRNTDLTGANMAGADLTDATWDNTFCPDGTNSNDNGNTCEGHLNP
ncbi:MAG: pentapeptide repeat-containing protein [Patescibacteria group bacterium]